MRERWVPVACAGAAGFALACGYLLRRVKELEVAVATAERLRGEERRGRTRAEVAHRNAVKEKRSAGGGGLRTTPIGHVTTPFTKRSGTPRQGGVCPSGRGVLALDGRSHPAVCGAALDGLGAYSHCWLLFEFHANTDVAFKSAKVAPPRGYGAKVGWLATRSPHRANPIGLSLVKIDAVDAKALRVHVSGIDLCDGTPVIDLKPYVPWDAPADGTFRAPEWVSQKDALAGVAWEPAALAALDRHAPLLKGAGYDARRDRGALAAARATVGEVLAQDPRNARRRNARQKGDESAKATANAAPYKVHFGGLEVTFRVDESDVAVVLDVAPAPPDDDRLRTATTALP